ncbi:hypothetical protein RXV95_12240 [Novosphingobium sp. ZN18A2]|uniref:hypothetical protein n=1 Tax=Novosphingobium sp. ZN18A2 TaxID=3079861 RepID=UPI0030CF5029
MPRLPIFVALAAALLPASAAADIVGTCHFDTRTLSFEGTPSEQATCLLQHVGPFGKLEQRPLPPVFARLLAEPGWPSAAQRDAAIADFDEPYRDYAKRMENWPASRTETDKPLAYFVIHDTSTPFYGDAPFPADIDHNPHVNSFAPYESGGLAADPVAHFFNNRLGQVWAGHDVATGWRATKLESRVVGTAARGRFVHVENVQPRRYAPGGSTREQTVGPAEGLSEAQYRTLAAIYVYTSWRAGRWLIPAFHATVDGGIAHAHDDPQNFDMKTFTAALELLLAAK